MAKYKHLQTNSDNGDIYRHYPRIEGKQHKYLTIRKPSDDLVEPYEKKKAEYNKELNRDLLEQLLEEQEDDETDEKDPKRIGDEILAEGCVGDYVKTNNAQEYLSTDLTELDYDIGSRPSKKVKAYLERESEDAP